MHPKSDRQLISTAATKAGPWRRAWPAVRAFWATPELRDIVFGVAFAGAGSLFALSLAASGAFDGSGVPGARSYFLSGLIAIAATIATGVWYGWRRVRGAKVALLLRQRRDEESRTIAAIGVGASWDLDPDRVLARFANDLKQLVEYDRIAMMTMRRTGGWDIIFQRGDTTREGGSGSPVGPAEPDGVRAPGELGYKSKVTVPFLAIDGTLLLRSKKPDVYGPRQQELLRQVVAQVTPGVANARLYEASRRQLRERTALSEIGRAAIGEHDLPHVFSTVGRALSGLFSFDHVGVILTAGENQRGAVAYWQPPGLLGVSEGAEIDLNMQEIKESHVSAVDRPFEIAAETEMVAGGAEPGRTWLRSRLMVRDELLGALVLRVPDRDAGSESARNLIEQVSLQIAPAIKNAQLLAGERALKLELDAQNQELQLAQQAKDRFLSAVSHELRTPLAIVTGFIDLLQSDPSGNLDAEQKETLAIMRRNSKRLSQLIGDLLDISRIGAKTFKVQKRVFNGADTLAAVIEDVKPLLDDKHQTLTFKMPKGAVWLDGDPDRLTQLVMNMLTNASKYSPAGTGVELAARWDAEVFAVNITDHGIGISPEEQAKLFTAFYRVDNETTRTVPGSGLGLHIAKTIAEMHSGKISLASEVGVGTTIGFTLPCVVGEPEAQEPQADLSAIPRSRLYPEMDMDDIPLTAA